MKRMAGVIVLLAIIMTFIPAFRVQAESEKTLFQIAHDSISETGKGTSQPQKVEVFNNMKDGLNTLDEASQKAKSMSLRGNDKELAKRRGACSK